MVDRRSNWQRSTINDQRSNQLFNDPEKMRDLRDDASHRWRVRSRNLLIELRDAETRYDQLLILRIADRAAIILDRDRSACFFFFLCHISSFKFQVSNFRSFRFQIENLEPETWNLKLTPRPAYREGEQLRADPSCGSIR